MNVYASLYKTKKVNSLEPLLTHDTFDMSIYLSLKIIVLTYLSSRFIRRVSIFYIPENERGEGLQRMFLGNSEVNKGGSNASFLDRLRTLFIHFLLQRELYSHNSEVHHLEGVHGS